MQLRDGTLLLTTFETNWAAGGANVATFVYRSTDGGKTFPTFAKIESTIGTYEHGPAVQWPNGDVLQPLYGSGARIARSTDGGKTFPADQAMTVVADNSQCTNREPNIVRLPNGELVMIIRMYFASVSAERESRNRPLLRRRPHLDGARADRYSGLLGSSAADQGRVGTGDIREHPAVAAPDVRRADHEPVRAVDRLSPTAGVRLELRRPGQSQQRAVAERIVASFGYDIITRQVVSWRTWPYMYR